jgi:hypothetical protein
VHGAAPAAAAAAAAVISLCHCHVRKPPFYRGPEVKIDALEYYIEVKG